MSPGDWGMDEKPPRLAQNDYKGLLNALGRNDRLAGLDLGEKTIGIAISDVERRFANPLKTLVRAKFSVNGAELLAIAKTHQIAGFVLGLPLNMDGSMGPRAQASRTFARNLAQITSIPVLFWDERMSTMAAERTLIEADLSRKKRAAVIDSAAAAFILQGALDRIAAIAADGDEPSVV
jgi:putative Holliday junction resolvase